MSDKKKVAIVIPMYRSEFNENDLLSLRSIEKNKGGNDIVIVAPEGFSIQDTPITNYNYEYFDKLYFKSSSTYSKLLLNCAFYERFYPKYSHILIIQLDALLLKCIDAKFEEYLAYDYIGAPWNPPVRGYKVFFKGMSAIKRFLEPKELLVGNGGFSLRNVSAIIALLKKHAMASKIWNTGEDVFFSYYGLLDNNFKIPNKEVAHSFAIEKKIEEVYSEKFIQYGVHAFEKNPSKVIEQLTDIILKDK